MYRHCARLSTRFPPDRVAAVLDDKSILNRARRVVTSNWFDLPRLRIRVTRGQIHLQGRFFKSVSAGDDQEGSESGLRKLDTELRGIAGCRGVTYEIENWIHEQSGGWRRRGKKQGTGKPAVEREQTVEIEDVEEPDE